MAISLTSSGECRGGPQGLQLGLVPGRVLLPGRRTLGGLCCPDPILQMEKPRPKGRPRVNSEPGGADTMECGRGAPSPFPASCSPGGQGASVPAGFLVKTQGSRRPLAGQGDLSAPSLSSQSLESLPVGPGLRFSICKVRRVVLRGLWKCSCHCIFVGVAARGQHLSCT